MYVIHKFGLWVARVMKTHKVGTRCSPREVKTVNRYVAGAAPSPVEAKKVCSAPRLSAWHVLMHLVCGSRWH